MSLTPGRNYGCTGILDIGTTSDSKFIVTAKGLDAELSTRTHDISGPGDGFASHWYGGLVDGEFTVEGEVQAAFSPFPNSAQTVHNVNGTLTLSQHTANSIAMPVLMEYIRVSSNKKTEDRWRWQGKGRKNGVATITWADKADSYTASLIRNQEIYSGTSKTFDPNGLQFGGRVAYTFATSAGSDAALSVAASAFVAQLAAPITNLTVSHYEVITRLDDFAAIMAVRWSPNTTVQDVTFPASNEIIDPQSISSSSLVASITAANSTTATYSGLQLREISHKQINPQKVLNVAHFGERTHKEDIEFPGTVTHTDVSDITTNGRQTLVFNTNVSAPAATIPTHTKTVSTATYQLTSAGTAKSYIVYEFSPQTTKDRIEQGGTNTAYDPRSLNSHALVTLVDATPGTQSGFTMRSLVSEALSDWHTKSTATYGLRTTQEDMEFPGTVTHVDPVDLTTNGRQTLVFNTGDAAPAATVPTHTKKVSTATYQFTSAGTAKSYVVYEFAPQTSKDRIEHGGTHTTFDTQSLNSTALVTLVDATPGTVSGFTMRSLVAEALSDFHTRSTATYALRTSKEDHEFPGTYNYVDANSISHHGRVTTIHATASPPSDPSPANGMKIVDKVTTRLTSSSATPLSETVWNLGMLDSADRTVFPSTYSIRSVAGPDRDTLSEITNSTSSTAAVADAIWSVFATAVNIRNIRVRPLTGSKKLAIYDYVDSGILLKGNTRGGGRWVHTRIDSGNTQVYVATNRSYGSGQRLIQLSRQYLYGRVLRRFLLVRTLSDSAVPEFASLIGKTNNASFIGLPAGTCLYIGPNYNARLDVSLARTYFMGYDFIADTGGIVEGVPEIFYNGPQPIVTSATSSGWVNVSALAALSSIVAVTQGDFAPFVA
jgi:hypothetical protein